MPWWNVGGWLGGNTHTPLQKVSHRHWLFVSKIGSSLNTIFCRWDYHTDAEPSHRALKLKTCVWGGCVQRSYLLWKLTNIEIGGGTIWFLYKMTHLWEIEVTVGENQLASQSGSLNQHNNCKCWVKLSRKGLWGPEKATFGYTGYSTLK